MSQRVIFYFSFLLAFFLQPPVYALRFEIPEELRDEVEAQKEAERAAVAEQLNKPLESELPETDSADPEFPEFSFDALENQPDSVTKDGGELERSTPDSENASLERVDDGTEADGFGRVAGQIFDKESGQPVRGAAVLIEGTDIGTISDNQGRYRLNKVPVGEYSLSFIKSGYIEATVTETRVMAGELMSLDFALPPRPAEMSDEVYVLQDFTVTAEEAISQNVALLSLRQTSIASIDALSSEDFAKFAASDIAEAVTKVSGASLSDGKYLVFRGLNDRYNVTLINGVRLPSPDPDRKAVPLDIFPTSLFESVVARKTYTSDMSGEASGGSIELRTKSVPEEPFIKFSFGVGGQDSGHPFIEDPEQVSFEEWLLGDDPRGFDHVPGGDALVSEYPNMVGDQNFPFTAPVYGNQPEFSDRSFSFSMGGDKQLSDWLSIGAVVGLKSGYQKRSKMTEVLRTSFSEGDVVTNRIGEEPQENASNDFEISGSSVKPAKLYESEEEYSISGLASFGLRISDHSELNYTFLYTDNMSSKASAINYALFEGDSASAYITFRDSEVGSQKRNLEAHQLSGSHTIEPKFFPNPIEFSWYSTNAAIEQIEPDQRLVSGFIPSSYDPQDPISRSGGYPDNPGLPGISRFQRETMQESNIFGFKFGTEFDLGSWGVFDLNLGFDQEESEREFEQLEALIRRDDLVDDILVAALPRPNGNSLVGLPSGQLTVFGDDFFEIDTVIRDLFDNRLTTVSNDLTTANGQLAVLQSEIDDAQIGFNAAQASLNANVATWEAITRLTYDPSNPNFTSTLNPTELSFFDLLVTPELAVVASEQDELDDAVENFNSSPAKATKDALDVEQANLTAEQMAYIADADGFIASISSMPALATDPSAFPSYTFNGQRDFILRTPERGFSIYAEGSSMTPAEDSASQFRIVEGKFAARGENEVESVFVSGNLKKDDFWIFESLRLAGGLRRESTALSYELLDDVAGEPGSTSSLLNGFSPNVIDSRGIDQSDNLFYLAAIFEITEDIKLHISKSKTVAKPTYREIAPFPIFNLSDLSVEIGNSGLTERVAGSTAPIADRYVVPDEFAGLEIANVDSRDIRLEWYTPLDGLISIGYFEKEIEAPIERVLAFQTSGVDINTFINNDNDAELSGVEFEINQNLGVFEDFFNLPLSWVTIGGNYTKIDAVVERSSFEKSNLTDVRFNSALLDPDVFQTGSESTRPLYDQPSFVANAFVTFDIEKTGTTLTLSNNWLGEQLNRAGGLGGNQSGSADFYWKEFSSMNLVIEQRLSDHWSLKFTAKNIDSPVRELEEADAFFSALVDPNLKNQGGGDDVTDSLGNPISGNFAFRSRQEIQPTFSISISGSF